MTIDPINVCVIGYGLSSKIFHIPFITTTPGLRLHSIIHRSPTTENDAAKDFPNVKVFRSIAEMYDFNEVGQAADQVPEVVVVTTGNGTHFSVCREALEKGKHGGGFIPDLRHSETNRGWVREWVDMMLMGNGWLVVVVEKPFTTTVEEADELIELSKKVGRVLMVYHNRRFDSDFKTLHTLLSSSSSPLGPIVSLVTHYDRHRPLPLHTTDPRTWKVLQVPGNGTLFDLGSHLIDQALILFGLPDRVFGIIRDERGASEKKEAVWGEEGFWDDFFAAELFWDGPRAKGGSGRWGVGVGERGLRVRIEAGSLCLREKQVRFVVAGEKGGFVKYGLDPQEPSLKAGSLPTDPDFGIESEETHGTLTLSDNTSKKIPSEKGDYRAFYESLCAAIKGVEEPVVKPEEARDVIRIIHLVGKSNREGRIVSLKE